MLMVCHELSTSTNEIDMQNIGERLYRKIDFFGIDASLNPGLELNESVGAGIESLLFLSTVEKGTEINLSPEAKMQVIKRPHVQFGQMGTLSAVSSITAALKTIQNNNYEIKLVGYNGLMLPVMEDAVLAARAAQNKPTFSLRDLLVFSSVCGVGLDTIPISGTSTIDQIASVYLEIGTLAYRLKKPLSCRLLPWKDVKAGEIVEVPPEMPYLINTRAFAI